jgi:hypothetical protein
MKHKMTTMLVFIILAAAMASLVAAEENITYVYTSASGKLIEQNSTNGWPQVNVTLPNTTWNLELSNEAGNFSIYITGINATPPDGYTTLDITAREVNLTAQNYDGPLVMTAGSTYVADYAYAFNISQMSSQSYRVQFDYSNTGVTSPRIFKCIFDYTTNITNTSDCSDETTGSDSTYVWADTTGFSSFFLAQYNAPAPQQTGSTGGGGGGGGGGLFGGPRTVYVTPTPEGESVQLINGDELIIQYKGSDYHFRVIKIVPLKVELRDLQTYLPFIVEFSETKNLGLTSYFARDVQVSMHVSNEFVMLTFKTYDKPSLGFQLLPPRPTARPAGTPAETVPPAVYTPRPTPAPETGAAPATEAPQQLEVPESPIGLWTIIFAIVFVIFLVGGIALYRTKLHRLEKPPTVTRTGLGPSGLPETSSKVSKPAPTLKPGEKAVEVKPKPTEPVTPAEQAKPVKPTKPVEVTHSQELVLEKYIFHAYSKGFNEAQVRQALIEKGWPGSVIDNILRKVKPKK